MISSMIACSFYGVVSDVKPKQIDVTYVPIFALKRLAKRDFRLVNLEHTTFHVCNNRLRKGETHL